MVRIRFAAAALGDFPVEEPGEIVTLVWPAEGREPVPPILGSWRFPPDAPEQHARNYTVRAHDPAAGTLDVDFVLHGDHGTASRWAATARPGDRLAYAGPRTHWVSAEDGAAWSLLIADETGLPALAAIVESLPPDHRAIALIEVGDAAERQPLRTRARLDAHWVERGDDALVSAARTIALPDGRGRVWGGGESGVMRRVRDLLREERGIPREAMRLLGYWKHDDTEKWDTE